MFRLLYICFFVLFDIFPVSQQCRSSIAILVQACLAFRPFSISHLLKATSRRPYLHVIMANTKYQMHGADTDEGGQSTPVASFNDSVKKLFLKKNVEMDKGVLQDLITEATDMCDSFLLEFEVSQIKGVADKLASLGIWDVKSFTNRDDLFKTDQPLWSKEGLGNEDKDIARAAEHLQLYLRNVRVKVTESMLAAKTEIGPRRPARDSSRGRSRDRKRRKKEDKKKDKRASSTGSSSSSDMRREASSDLIAMVTQTEFKDIPLEHFPHVKMASKVLKKCKAGSTLSSDAIGRWIPQHVGSELPSADQKKLVAEREKSASLSLAQLLEQSAAFWLTHGVAKRVHLVSVFKHILLLIKMASQGNTGIAVQYERMLIQHVRNIKGDVNINCLIAEKQTPVETAVNIHFSRLAKPKEAPSIQRQTSQWSGPRAKPNEADRRDRPAGATRPQTDGKRAVCFYHNPREGKSCKYGDKCKLEHLDTTKHEQKQKFEKMRAARRF